jgi:hypothetical protein
VAVLGGPAELERLHHDQAWVNRLENRRKVGPVVRLEGPPNGLDVPCDTGYSDLPFPLLDLFGFDVPQRLRLTMGGRLCPVLLITAL